jgi:hypothetical protein
MAVSSFTQSIEALVQAERLEFLTKVSTDYKIDLSELLAKYSVHEKVKRKYIKKDPKSVDVDGKNVEGKKICEASTSKNVLCKFAALKGGCFCKRHQRKADEADGVKNVKETKPSKAEHPVHTHPLDEEDVDCGLCQSHGNPLNGMNEEFEVVVPKVASATGPIKKQNIAEKIAAMMDEDEDEDEDEADAEVMATQQLSDYEEE